MQKGGPDGCCRSRVRNGRRSHVQDRIHWLRFLLLRCSRLQTSPQALAMSAVRTLVPPNFLTRRSRHLFTELFIFLNKSGKIGIFCPVRYIHGVRRPSPSACSTAGTIAGQRDVSTGMPDCGGLGVLPRRQPPTPDCRRWPQCHDAGNRGISATPCATAHGAHSGTSTPPPRSVGSRRVITARLSHIPMSSGCDLAQTHSQSRWPQTRVVRQDSSTARMAGSLDSLWNASLVMAAVCSAHSVTTAVAASQAAANCRNGLFSPLMTTSSHLEWVVGNRIMPVHAKLEQPAGCDQPLPQAHW